MRTTQLARQKRGEEVVNMYGIVSSGDLIQIHRLREPGELQSSSLMLLTAEGFPTIWHYLREIINEIQLTAAPPSRLKRSMEMHRSAFRYEELILTHYYGLKPDGAPHEEPAAEGGGDVDSKRAAQLVRHRRRRVKGVTWVADDAECDQRVGDESDNDSEGWDAECKPYVYPSDW
ncbi:hypothetical protein BJY00DRAFT_291684 [Aspergillus carlsbadensis]|nr:hypothetical protein BJY00DRAFT_291684 [Aspergillus carlsbadensis]